MINDAYTHAYTIHTYMNKIKDSKRTQYNAFFHSPIFDYSDLSDRLRLLEKIYIEKCMQLIKIPQYV